MTTPVSGASRTPPVTLTFDPTHPALVANQKALREQSEHHAACVSEGFCPRCHGPLTSANEPYDGECKRCDSFWKVGPKHPEHGGHNWSSTAGWFVREGGPQRPLDPSGNAPSEEAQ